MLQVGSNVIIADNTWAKKAQIFRILKSSNARQATIGDTVVVAIKEAAPTSSIKKGDVAKAIIVRMTKEVARKDWTYVRFWDNAIILIAIDAKWEMKPIGKRIFGPVSRELKERWMKIITNMAEEVV